MNEFRAWGILIKPKVLLAMITLYITTFFSSNLLNTSKTDNVISFFYGLIAVIIAVIGANAMNNFLDRDIDSVMIRTRGRYEAINLVGEVSLQRMGILFLTISSLVSMAMGIIPLIIFLIGSGFYLVIYTVLLKRKTSLNVIATLPSIISPACLGWYLGGSPLYPLGLLIILQIVIWGPLHLWSLAYTYSKDYTKANIPMLSSVISQIRSTKIIFILLLMQIFSSYLLIPWAKSFIYLVGISIVNFILFIYGLLFLQKKNGRSVYYIFKLTAPYIIALLTLFVLDLIVMIY